MRSIAYAVMRRSRSWMLRFSFLCSAVATVLFACSSDDPLPPNDDAQHLTPDRDASPDTGRTTPPGPAADASPDGAVTDAGPTEPDSPFETFYESVEAGGKTHNYLVVIPRERGSAPLPIVFAYHGDGGSGEGARASFQVEHILPEQAIVVYPSCPANPAWNLYGRAGNEYLAGFDAILDAVATAHDGDRSQVSAMGHSSGGFFAGMLGCYRSAKLRSVGIMSGGAPFKQAGDDTWNGNILKCPGQTPVAVFVAHDEGDPVVPYSSGKWASEYFMYANRCPSGNCNANPESRSPTLGGVCMNMDPAPAEFPVVICATRGNGHGLWGSFVSTFWQFTSAL